MIVFKLDRDGGFRVGDTVTGRTAYAYPSSLNANAAKRAPEKIAEIMARQENQFSPLWRDTPEHKARDAASLAKITS